MKSTNLLRGDAMHKDHDRVRGLHRRAVRGDVRIDHDGVRGSGQLAV